MIALTESIGNIYLVTRMVFLSPAILLVETAARKVDVMTGEIFNAVHMKGELQWDVDLEREFMQPRRTGYTFVIDICDGVPRLAVYRIRSCYSASTTLEQQPPAALLERAVGGRGATMPADNLYPINDEVRSWIEQNLLS